jgi:transcriptional regulator with XRE-family HTH domain
MSEIEWLEIFGDNLINLLDKEGMTQRELAEATGLSEGTISSYINKRKIPGIKAIINMAYVLECSIDDLIDFGDTII